MDTSIAPGTRRVVNGQTRVYYEGYWIKTYPVPENTLAQKKLLIEALTRRLFNHTEHGLNIPGIRLEEARQAYESESDPAKRRVKGAMYAGAMFNLKTDSNGTGASESRFLRVVLQPPPVVSNICATRPLTAIKRGVPTLLDGGAWGAAGSTSCSQVTQATHWGGYGMYNAPFYQGTLDENLNVIDDAPEWDGTLPAEFEGHALEVSADGLTVKRVSDERFEELKGMLSVKQLGGKNPRAKEICVISDSSYVVVGSVEANR